MFIVRTVSVYVSPIVILVACVSALAQEPAIAPAQVVLSWDTTGRFGPQTPGTKTAGWQEAIDYCVAQGHDLYVKGGWGGRKAIYNIADTIHIPATQDFRIDGGVYVLNWTGAADDPAKDLMVIDSTMNGEYHFGIFVYGGAGAAMRIKPEKPVPIDGFAVVVETEIKSQGMADPAPFTPGERKAGTGLVLDATLAPIVSSRFDFIGGILNFKTCVEAQGKFVQNHFDCLHLHTNACKSVLFHLGPECTQNHFGLTIGVDQGATDVRGIVIEGFNNTFDIMTRGGFPRSNDMVLAESARGNRIDLTHGKTEFDPADFITDNAAIPTNRLTWVGANPKIATLTPPVGEWTYTQRLYSATIHLSGGTLSALSIARCDTILEYPPATTHDLQLDPADALRITSTAPQTLQVIPRP